MTELAAAARAVVQANCRPHREKAMRRLEAALAVEKVARAPEANAALVQDLLRYVAQDAEGQGRLADAAALTLLQRARDLGLW